MLETKLTTRRMPSLERLSELALGGIAAVGCLGTYVVALTVGLKAFVPLAGALAIAIGTLGILALAFSLLGRRYRRVGGGAQTVIRGLSFRDHSGPTMELPAQDAA